MSDPVQSTALLQLSPALLAAWNETAFWAYFDGLQGAPYGVNNFMLSFFDQGDPLGSLPAPLSSRTVSAFLVSADALLGDADTGLFQPSYNCSVFGLIGPALRLRLPAAAGCATLACLLQAAQADRRLSLLAAAALPEDPAWEYGGAPARVCSAFCAGGLAAGLGAALPPRWETEPAPRDNWAADVWAAAGWDAVTCPTGLRRSTTGVAYCQFAGLYALPLDGVGAVGPPYPHANEGCGSRWPAYTRCPGNQTACRC